MSETVNLAHLQLTIRKAMVEAETNPKRLAREIRLETGKSETLIRDILSGKSSNPTLETVRAIAKGLNKPLEYFIGAGGVPVVGKIGAGGSIIYEENGAPEHVNYPPDTRGQLIGLEVEGESMLPKFDPGDVIYINPASPGAPEEYLGWYCAVRTANGSTFLKVLARGSTADRFTLRSLNAADMEDVEIEWATPVRAILPRHARRL